MRFYYHLLHITKRLYVSHNGGCEAQVRHKKAPHHDGRGRKNCRLLGGRRRRWLGRPRISFISNAKSTTGCYYCQCFKNPRPSLTPTDRGPVQTSLTGGYGRNRPDVVRPRYPYRAGT